MIHNPLRVKGLVAALLAGSATVLFAADTFYVSPAGNDANNGLSPATAWRTAAKVNAASGAFPPETTVLFERGGEWRERLKPLSSGTAAKPIVFDTYGDPAEPKPIFWGSDILANGAFQPEPGTASTYRYTIAQEVHSVFADHTFLRSGYILSGRNTDLAAQLDVVNITPYSWAWNSGTLYVNTGGTDPRTSGTLWTATLRDDVIHCDRLSHLVIRNLVADESAKDGAGYAFRVEGSTNILLENCEAYRAGKHHFGVINSTGFVGRGLIAGGSALPGLGFGGATYLVSFSDATRSGDTSQWIDCTVENDTWGYLGFYSHGPGMGSVLVENPHFIGAELQTGISDSYPVTVRGGLIESVESFRPRGSLTLNGANTFVDGMILRGKVPVRIQGGGNHLIQNLLIEDAVVEGGAAVILAAPNSIFRFNTMIMRADTTQSCLWVRTGSSSSAVYGNIIQRSPVNTTLWREAGASPSIRNNLYVAQPAPVFNNDGASGLSFAAWKALGFDQGSAVADPGFTDPASSAYTLRPGSPAINFVPESIVTVPIDSDGSQLPRPLSGGYDAGAFEKPVPGIFLKADGTASGVWIAEPYHIYDVQRSLNLIQWVTSGTATSLGEGAYFYADGPGHPYSGGRFFRLLDLGPDRTIPIFDFDDDFAGSESLLNFNGSARIAGARARLTEATTATGDAGTIWSRDLVDIRSFATEFMFQLTGGNGFADGFTFAIQRSGNELVGGAGGWLGYAGIGNSTAIKFDTYPNSSTTGLYTDGTPPTEGPATIDMAPSGINIRSGRVFHVLLTYDGATLHQEVTDTVTDASFTRDYGIDIPAVVGGNAAYIGFTGAIGGQTSVQEILDWSYSLLPFP